MRRMPEVGWTPAVRRRRKKRARSEESDSSVGVRRVIVVGI